MKEPILINRKAMKAYILSRAKYLRPGWRCERVSAMALQEIEIMIKYKVDRMISMHPTVGKTFKEVQ
jgi:hypothetical protein